jgi:hypothetical protein
MPVARSAPLNRPCQRERRDGRMERLLCLGGELRLSRNEGEPCGALRRRYGEEQNWMRVDLGRDRRLRHPIRTYR